MNRYTVWMVTRVTKRPGHPRRVTRGVFAWDAESKRAVHERFPQPEFLITKLIGPDDARR